jgi:hypothetical protein
LPDAAPLVQRSMYCVARPPRVSNRVPQIGDELVCDA